ncbi:Protein kinase-like domain containing protein [Elaphomyces granulatus]
MSLHDCDALDHGDILNSDDEEFDELFVYTEGDQGYHRGSGLYFPICIGDVLNQRYCIEHKLGHGSYSTVWLAHNIQEKRAVALKIIVSGNAGENEYNMQKEIIHTVKDTSNFLTYLTTFTLPGYKGNHRVLVFPMRGSSLESSRHRGYWDVSVATRMSGARQLLKALECLHNAGIVHQDLDDRNVMWGITPLDNLDKKAKYEHLGRPQKIPISTIWRKAELVMAAKIPKSLLTETIYLSDFGMAFKAGTTVERIVLSPHAFRAPELFHKVDPSFASDMWSYMCLFSRLYFNWVPWHNLLRSETLDEMVKVLGPLPEQWKGNYIGYEYNNSWYDQSTTSDFRSAIERLIQRERPETSPTERNHVLSVMSKVFCYRPEDRLTAQQLLRDDSFKALMEIYKVSMRVWQNID